jgi:hypothetical protein
MLERIANSRTFVSLVLAGMTGLMLATMYPFPQGNLYLQYVALRDPLVYSVLARSYTLFLFPIVATQSISSLKSTLSGDSYRLSNVKAKPSADLAATTAFPTFSASGGTARLQTAYSLKPGLPAGVNRPSLWNCVHTWPNTFKSNNCSKESVRSDVQLNM